MINIKEYLFSAVFGPLKKAWHKVCSDFITWTGVPPSKVNFFRLLSKAWKELSPTHVTSGFVATGIYPFNPKAIPESAYIPSTINLPFDGK